MTVLQRFVEDEGVVVARQFDLAKNELFLIILREKASNLSKQLH